MPESTNEPIVNRFGKVDEELKGFPVGKLIGLETAYAAYRRYVARHGDPLVLNGIPGD